MVSLLVPGIGEEGAELAHRAGRDQPFQTLHTIHHLGMWWIVIFPVLQLSLLVISVNLLGDWLRDALNPKLR